MNLTCSQKSVVFLYSSNKQYKNKIFKTTQFTILPENVKYLGKKSNEIWKTSSQKLIWNGS